MDLSKFLMLLSLLTKLLLNSGSVSLLLHKGLSLSWSTHTTNVSDPASTKVTSKTLTWPGSHLLLQSRAHDVREQCEYIHAATFPMGFSYLNEVIQCLAYLILHSHIYIIHFCYKLNNRCSETAVSSSFTKFLFN